MIRQARNLKWISPRFQYRYQTTVASTLSKTNTPVNESAQFQSAQVEAAQTSNTIDSKTSNNIDKTKKRQNQYRAQQNEKFTEVSKQVYHTIKESDFDESIEIYVEGISYLRNIQESENIRETLIYNEYERLGSILLARMLASNDVARAEQFLDILKKYKVAHSYHFFLIMAQQLKNGGDDKYERMLQIWVKYLEAKGSTNATVNINNMRPYLVEADYNPHRIVHLAYFAYCQGYIRGKYEYNIKDVTQLLQVEEPPQLYRLKNTLSKLQIPNFTRDIRQFENMFRAMSMKNLNPNDNITLRKIEEYTMYKDIKGLRTMYEEIKQNIKANSINISSLTIYKILSSFYELESFQDVFRVFQDILPSGNIDKSIWELIIKSLGNTQYLETLKPNERESIVSRLENTISTMLSQGHPITSRTVSSIVGSFANLNRFDKVDEYLDTYKNLAVLKSTNEAILIGLCFNGKIEEAEAKLETLMESKTYIPSTKVMNSFLTYHSKLQNYEAIRGIIEFMEKNKVPEDVISLTIIIDTYFKAYLSRGQRPKVDQVLELFQNSSFKINYVTYTVILDTLIKSGNIQAARGIFEFLQSSEFKQKLSPQVMTSMLKGELNSGSIEKAQTIFQEYISKFRHDTRLWNLMIQELLRKNDALALDYYSQLKQQSVNKIYPNFFTYYFLINHFKRRNNTRVLQMLVQDLSETRLDDYGNELPKLLNQISKEISLPKDLQEVLLQV